MKKNILSLLALIALIATIFAACSKSGGYNTTTPPVISSTDAAVNIQNFAFYPSSVNIKAGGTVTWTNVDATAHTVTDLKGAFDSGNIASNATFKQTFNTPGTYTYHCLIHSMMANATVVVSN